MAHPSKKLAVSLVAMIATLALFAAVSAFAHGAPGSEAPIINPAIDLPCVSSASTNSGR